MAKQSVIFDSSSDARVFSHEVSGTTPLVELVGFEPTTSWMQARRSPARATTPYIVLVFVFQCVFFFLFHMRQILLRIYNYHIEFFYYKQPYNHHTNNDEVVVVLLFYISSS